MGKNGINQSVGKGHTKWLRGPGCGPRATCCTPLFYEVAVHVGRVKTIVTNHLRKMFRSRIHKAAKRNTAARINSDKLTDADS